MANYVTLYVGVKLVYALTKVMTTVLSMTSYETSSYYIKQNPEKLSTKPVTSMWCTIELEPYVYFLLNLYLQPYQDFYLCKGLIYLRKCYMDIHLSLNLYYLQICQYYYIQINSSNIALFHRSIVLFTICIVHNRQLVALWRTQCAVTRHFTRIAFCNADGTLLCAQVCMNRERLCLFYLQLNFTLYIVHLS